MSLSEKQKMQLELIAHKLKPSSVEPQIIEVSINTYLNTRETGTGYPICVGLRYLSDMHLDINQEISRCQTDYTALAKSREIARYIAKIIGKSNVCIKNKAKIKIN